MPEARTGGAGDRCPPVWDVRRFGTIGSTNRYLMDEALRGAREGVVAVAAFQEEGRGRLDRRWIAPPGSSLLASVLLRPELDPDEVHWTVAVTALATVDACGEVAGVRPDVKWPNDVVAPAESGPLAGRKLAGVLAEVAWDAPGGGVPAVVVGVGLNVTWPEGMGEDPDVAARGVALNHLTTRSLEPDDLLDSFLHHLGTRYIALGDDRGRREQMRDYRSRCATISQSVEVDMGSEAVRGVALDVDDSGRLLVDVGACIRTVAFGDVVHVTPVGRDGAGRRATVARDDPMIAEVGWTR